MLNVRSGPYQLPPGEDFRFHLMEDIKDAVPDYEQRQKIAQRIYEFRGGSGITKDELKSAINAAVNNSELDAVYARALEKLLGVYG